MKKLLFFISLLFPGLSFAQTTSNYYCAVNNSAIGTNIINDIQTLFSIGAYLYNRYAIFLFLFLLIFFIWDMIQMFMNKELNWEVLNKNAWRFGPLIAAGLLLNVMAGGNGTDGKYYKDTRDPNTRLVRCSPSTPDAHQVPRVYLKNIK